jgi:hypothetical protein
MRAPARLLFERHASRDAAHVVPPSQRTPWSWTGWLVTGGLIVLYVFGYFALHPVIGDQARNFFVVPLLVGAWYFGMRGGMMVTAIGFFLQIVLGGRVDILDLVTGAVIAVGFGWVSEMRVTLRNHTEELTAERTALRAQIALGETRETVARTRARQQALVADVGSLSVSGASPEDVVRAATLAAQEGLATDYAALLENVPGMDKLAVRGIAGAPEAQALGVLIPAGRGSHSGYTLLMGAPTIIEDYASDTRFHAPMYSKSHKLVSGASVIVGDPKGDPYGVLCVHTHAKRLFDQQDVHFLQCLANVVAMRIEKAREPVRPDARTIH